MKHPNEALPEEEEDELVVVQDEENLICPILRKLLEQPVRKYAIFPFPLISLQCVAINMDMF